MWTGLPPLLSSVDYAIKIAPQHKIFISIFAEEIIWKPP